MSVYDQLVGMEDILDEFIDESSELLIGIRKDLESLESDLEVEPINRIIWTFNAIKGTCGFLGFEQAKMVAHLTENLLNQRRNGKLAPGGEIIAVLQESCNWFERFLGAVKKRQEREFEIWPLLKRLSLAGHGDEKHSEVEALQWLISARLKENRFSGC